MPLNASATQRPGPGTAAGGRPLAVLPVQWQVATGSASECNWHWQCHWRCSGNLERNLTRNFNLKFKLKVKLNAA